MHQTHQTHQTQQTPQSKENQKLPENFEELVLKQLTLDGEYFSKVVPIVQHNHFVSLGSQELFKLLKKHYTEYKLIPSLTELVAHVKDVSNSNTREEIKKTLKNVNGLELVKNTDFMVNQTVGWVKNSMFMQALQIGADGLSQNNDDMKNKSKQIIEEMQKISVDSDLGFEFDDVTGMVNYLSERKKGVTTPHKQLNKRLGDGFLRGTLSNILAASGVGKSLLMTDLISGMIKEQKNVLLVSLEMADKEIMKRVYSNALDLPINALSDLSKTPGELAGIGRDKLCKEDVLRAYNEFKMSGTCGRLFVKDYPSNSFSPLMLEQLIETYRIEKGIEFDIVFVDYLGIMKSDLVSMSAGLYSYVKSISEELRAVAAKKNLPIVSASQLNRGSVNQVKDPDNSNVSDSMGTVMTSDFLLFLLQNEEMKEKGEIVAKCTKNRFTGITDTWIMSVDYKHMRFGDMVVSADVPDSDVHDMVDGAKKKTGSIDDDFGVVTAEKLRKADEFANSEIKDIMREDTEKVKEFDQNYKETPKETPKKPKENAFIDNVEDIYKDLGID